MTIIDRIKKAIEALLHGEEEPISAIGSTAREAIRNAIDDAKKTQAVVRATRASAHMSGIISALKAEESRSTRRIDVMHNLSAEFDRAALEIENALIDMRDSGLLTEKEYEERADHADKGYNQVRRVLKDHGC